jgi:arylsulfatase A-like enzyme
MKMSKFSTLKSACVRILLLSCFVVAATALWADPPKRVNVIFFVLDQLQADRLHCYGNSRETSPNIDRLAQRGVRFSHFFSVAPWTSPSFASLHTSLYPSRHGVTLEWGPGDPLISNSTPMMAPIFKGDGYYTTAFVNNGYDGYQLIGRGFDEFYEEQSSAQLINVTERLKGNNPYTAIEETRDVLAWLDQHKSQNFFLYVHYYEPHSPYNPPPEDDIFRSDAYPYLFDTGYDIAHAPAKRLAMLGDQKAIERLYQLYDGKIHFIDRYVGEILDRVRALGLEENTLVVLTADHGELLYSHPSDYLTFDHRSLYDAVLHVPLIMAGPDIPKGRAIDGLTSNIDTAPTVLDLAGLPALSDAQGQSLIPLIQGARESLNTYVYGEEDLMPPVRSTRTLHYKLIRNLWTGQETLFDLDHDPGEQRDVAQDKPAVMKDLRDHLDEWLKQNEPSKAEQLRRFRIYGDKEADLGQAKPGAYPTITVDDMTIGARFDLTGTQGWHSDTEPRSGNYAQGCFWTEPGDGSRTAIWRTDNPLLGTYKIYVYHGHPSVGRFATNAPFTVVTDKDSKTEHVDFTKEAGEWHLLGIFQNPRYVSLSNAADGVIVADAVRFEMISPE